MRSTKFSEGIITGSIGIRFCYSYFYYSLCHSITAHKAFEQGNFKRYFYLVDKTLYWSLVVTYIFPIMFFCYVWITIWCRGYMPSDTGMMKQLVRHSCIYCVRLYRMYLILLIPNEYTHSRWPNSSVIYYNQVWYFLHIFVVFLCNLAIRNGPTSRWSSRE